ncbi:hypothetical protein ABIG06_006428 [Bradyrhizobium sp. USDA 326]|uniref:hypothetical protein n=1 Tax=unclassified Bradyrhizobium TaxID=2631580 RepID=UPI000F54B1E8|nr:hypothetical protein [Bradyrhizobium sp. RP6]RQH11843.1 hypothetical protein EHH60_19255 [Bradyrhizobium sp. RP6]
MQNYLQPGILHFPPWGWSNAACHHFKQAALLFPQPADRPPVSAIMNPVALAMTEVLPVRAPK